MKPEFNYGFKRYTRDRKFIITDIAGWEKKHYVPEAPSLFWLEEDCFVYTADDKTQMLVLTAHFDEVNLHVYFLEKSDAFQPDTFDNLMPIETSISAAISHDIDQHESTEYKVYLVNTPPHITELKDNAFYLVRVKSNYILYFADADHGLYTKIEDESSTPGDFNKNILLLAAALEAGELNKGDEILKQITSQSIFLGKRYGWQRSSEQHNDSNETRRVHFCSNNNPKHFKKLIQALAIFQKHLKMPEPVIQEISSFINHKKDNFIQERINLAMMISDDSVSAGEKISGLLKNVSDTYGITEHFLGLARWYAANGNPEIALFLCMHFPASNACYLKAHELAQHYLLSDEYEMNKNEHYLEELATVSLRIALKSQNKDDLTHATRLINQLEGKGAFEASPIIPVESDLLAAFFISKVVEISQLRERLKIAEAADQRASVSGDAQLMFTRQAMQPSQQKPVPASVKSSRRNSI